MGKYLVVVLDANEQVKHYIVEGESEEFVRENVWHLIPGTKYIRLMSIATLTHKFHTSDE